MPADPTLNQPGALTVTIKAHTPHAAYARLWLFPPGAADWEQEREVADGSNQLPDSTTYQVTKGMYLGWNLSVGSTAGASDYLVTITLKQNGVVITDGSVTIEGHTDDTGVDVDIDHVRLL